MPIVSLSARLRASPAPEQVQAPPTEDTQSPNQAVYLDAHGRWWDETYTLCKVPPFVHLHPSQREEEEEETDQKLQLLAFVQSHPRPLPAEFSSYGEYETALLDWKDLLENAILSAEIILPTPLGRYHYRPVFHPPSTYSI